MVYELIIYYESNITLRNQPYRKGNEAITDVSIRYSDPPQGNLASSRNVGNTFVTFSGLFLRFFCFHSFVACQIE